MSLLPFTCSVCVLLSLQRYHHQLNKIRVCIVQTLRLSIDRLHTIQTWQPSSVPEFLAAILGTPGGDAARPAPTTGISPAAARRPCLRPAADVPGAVATMSNDYLTAVLQQVTTQMASDHQWFASIGHDLNDHAQRLDKLGLATVTNKANQEASATENLRAFKLIEASDLTVKDVVSQVTNKVANRKAR